MKWASSLATSVNLSEAIASVAQDVRRQLQGHQPDLAVLFVSSHYASAYDQVPVLLGDYLQAKVLIGCSAAGVIGGGQELENKPAVSLTAALLPGTEIKTIYTDTQDLPDEDAPPDVWLAWLGLPENKDTHFIILADPFSSMAEPFLTGLDYTFPEGAKIGGMASGGMTAGENILYLNDQTFRRGLIAVALSGDVMVDTVVAQGCRPIGEPAVVTKCNQNFLVEIDHQPPLQYLGQLVEQLSDYDRNLMRTSLFLGVQMDPMNDSPKRGDFLIRNLIGIDYNAGVLGVGALLQEGQIVQFHLRDKVTSSEDLEEMLRNYAVTKLPVDAQGALLFSCVGRGQHLYGLANHDTSVFREKIKSIPIGGFFCNGEIGPIGSTTYIHGYTSSFGVFRSMP